MSRHIGNEGFQLVEQTVQPFARWLVGHLLGEKAALRHAFHEIFEAFQNDLATLLSRAIKMLEKEAFSDLGQESLLPPEEKRRTAHGQLTFLLQVQNGALR